MKLKQIRFVIWGTFVAMTYATQGLAMEKPPLKSCDDVCLDTATGCLTVSETTCTPEIMQCVKACRLERGEIQK